MLPIPRQKFGWSVFLNTNICVRVSLSLSLYIYIYTTDSVKLSDFFFLSWFVACGVWGWMQSKWTKNMKITRIGGFLKEHRNSARGCSFFIPYYFHGLETEWRENITTKFQTLKQFSPLRQWLAIFNIEVSANLATATREKNTS